MTDVTPLRTRRLDPEDAIRRYRKGDPVREIAADYGVTPSTVHHAIRYHTDDAFREQHIAAATERSSARARKPR